ncbi:MAG: hypothetical protein BMS9Abin36_0544 [Gammaproteobacteria bacterium]|nr:MAG: hypothetical protein BMS9Abin36_0544 [Gammaproteobacteria bacterium]
MKRRNKMRLWWSKWPPPARPWKSGRTGLIAFFRVGAGGEPETAENVLPYDSTRPADTGVGIKQYVSGPVKLKTGAGGEE